ncbi:MAG: hypothetical protein ACHP85_15380 [Burkholderiales bacterium]
MSGGDYLWDKTGEPDAEIQALEERLRPLGRLPPPPQWSGRRGRRWRWLGLATAAALALALGASLLRTRPATRPGHGWELAWLEGASWSDARVVRAETLAEGEWIETREARARLAVGREGDEIGQVRLEPGTRIGLVDPGDRRHRLSLARGVIHATIWAPPGDFVVDTPSAVAVDMGCRYTLEVDEAGAGLLRVESGWVGFEHRGLQSLVPQGALCATRKGVGPGTPFFESASPAFARALEAIDFGPRGSSGEALQRVLAESSARDALSLWHLLARTSGEERGRVYDRLDALLPAPSGVTRDGVLRGERAMRERWWDELGLGSSEFWRMWTGSWSDAIQDGAAPR